MAPAESTINLLVAGLYSAAEGRFAPSLPAEGGIQPWSPLHVEGIQLMEQRRVLIIGGLTRNLQHHSSNIVVRRITIRKCHLAAEDDIQRLGCRLVPTLCPNLLHLGGTELDSLHVA